MKLIYGIIIFVVTFTILLINQEDQNASPENMPPEGYTTDYLLKTNDLKNGVSKAEIKRRERTGYYWIECDHNGVIKDKKRWGKPKY